MELKGWTSCTAWSNQTATFYNSTMFLAKQTANSAFLTYLGNSGLIGNRTVALSNMYNIFDFMNVQNVSTVVLRRVELTKD